jgi:hypothetical protein
MNVSRSKSVVRFQLFSISACWLFRTFDMISQETRVTVLFHRRGPCHFARLRAAGRLYAGLAPGLLWVLDSVLSAGSTATQDIEPGDI